MYKKMKLNGQVMVIIKVSTHENIPLDTENPDYRAFLEWEQAGGVAEEVDL